MTLIAALHAVRLHLLEHIRGLVLASLPPPPATRKCARTRPPCPWPHFSLPRLPARGKLALPLSFGLPCGAGPLRRCAPSSRRTTKTLCLTRQGHATSLQLRSPASAAGGHHQNKLRSSHGRYLGAAIPEGARTSARVTSGPRRLARGPTPTPPPKQLQALCACKACSVRRP